jgi:hypothetical protein
VSNYPAHQGGDRARASQVWGTTVRHGMYGVLLPTPPAPSAPVEVVDDTPQPAADTDHERHDWTEITHTNLNGGLSLGRWLIRFWLRVTVHRRKP